MLDNFLIAYRSRQDDRYNAPFCYFCLLKPVREIACHSLQHPRIPLATYCPYFGAPHLRKSKTTINTHIHPACNAFNPRYGGLLAYLNLPHLLTNVILLDQQLIFLQSHRFVLAWKTFQTRKVLTRVSIYHGQTETVEFRFFML